MDIVKRIAEIMGISEEEASTFLITENEKLVQQIREAEATLKRLRQMSGLLDWETIKRILEEGENNEVYNKKS